MSSHGERHQPVTANHSNPSVTLVSSHAQPSPDIVSLQHSQQPHPQPHPQQSQQHHSQHQQQHPAQLQQQSLSPMPSGAHQQQQPASQGTPNSVAVSAAATGSGSVPVPDDFALHHLEDGFTDLTLGAEFTPVDIKLENAFSPFMENEIAAGGPADQRCVSGNNIYNNFANNMPNLIAHSVESTHQLHSSNNSNNSNNNAQINSPIYTAIIDNNKNKQFHSDEQFPNFSPTPNAEHLYQNPYMYAHNRPHEDEESFDSDDTFSDESSIRHKPMLSDVMLQSMPDNFVQPGDINSLKNSKKICFEDLNVRGGPGGQSGMNFPPSQNAQYPNLTLVHQAIACPGMLLNQFDPNIQNPQNVPNSYGYAYRRWSNRDAPSVKNTKSGSIQMPHTIPSMLDCDRDFQYLLGAPTAAGTKHGEMTMTYLNQGQSYEIRLKRIQKTADLSNMKTTIRLGFYEKRLLYKETEEIANWNVLNPKDRPLEIDIAMSYGVFNINAISEFNNIIQFEWNPGREASIFIKINCISTAFTFKRHGGERGSPFRLIIDTMSNTDNKQLDKASCLIKVFKSKGAERKHKTDRDRIAKVPEADKLFRPSTDCTVFTTYEEEPLPLPKAEKDDLTITSCGSSSAMGLIESGAESPISSNAMGQLYHRNSDTPSMAENSPTLSQCHNPNKTPQRNDMAGSISSPMSNSDPSSTLTHCAQPATPSCLQLPQSTSQTEENLNNSSMLPFDAMAQNAAFPFPVGATAIDTYHWLRKHRFFQLAERLCEYTANDLKRLSKLDLLDLCDRKDGLRLYNLIHSPEGAPPRLKLFITIDGEEYFTLYLKENSVKEFKEKLPDCLQCNGRPSVRNLHIMVRGGLKVRVTDTDLENIRRETIFLANFIKVSDDEFDVQLTEMENTVIDS